MVASIRWREQHRNYVADALSAWAATGEPVLAPVWLRFPADAVCAPGGPADDGACGDAFMFGEDFLAKPVTEYGAATSWVWLPALPAGEAWQHAFTGATFEGGQNVTVATPIDSFPLFQRVPAV